jgi:hypothetical protein
MSPTWPNKSLEPSAAPLTGVRLLLRKTLAGWLRQHLTRLRAWQCPAPISRCRFLPLWLSFYPLDLMEQRHQNGSEIHLAEQRLHCTASRMLGR